MPVQMSSAKQKTSHLSTFWTFPLCCHCTVSLVLGFSRVIETKLCYPVSNGRTRFVWPFRASLYHHRANPNLSCTFLLRHACSDLPFFSPLVFTTKPPSQAVFLALVIVCCWCLLVSLCSSNLLTCVLRIHTAGGTDILLCRTVSISHHLPHPSLSFLFASKQGWLTTKNLCLLVHLRPFFTCFSSLALPLPVLATVLLPSL